MFLFIVLINSVGFHQEDKNIGERITRAANAHKVIKQMHAKYIDDLTVAEALNLKEVLTVEREEELIRPLNYHKRTEHKIKVNCSRVEDKLAEIEEHARQNQMEINQKKTKLMLFNTAIKYDYKPHIEVNGETLEVVSRMKLLGVIITDNLKWHENTAHITKKAFSRLWIIRRLKSMGASKTTLIDIYYKQIRSVLEFASVVWTAGLTLEDISKIERVQKSVCSVIIGSEYNTYKEALDKLNMKTLKDKRKELALQFAKKS
jgi:hypothetical protein